MTPLPPFYKVGSHADIKRTQPEVVRTKPITRAEDGYGMIKLKPTGVKRSLLDFDVAHAMRKCR